MCSVHKLKLFQVVGVADPRKFARTKLQQQHNIVDENIFEGEHQKIQLHLIVYNDLSYNKSVNDLCFRLAHYG